MVKFEPMRAIILILFAQVLGSISAVSAGDRFAEEARPRVEHHLLEAEQLVQHFESVLSQECPRFGTAGERRAYVDGEVEQAVLLVAHLDQAWVEAKRTSDKDVRRAAKAPRAQVKSAQRLITKLQTCAGDDGALEPSAVWRRVEQEVPRRQAEIALPQ